jgi:pimeloyl-ACP methyl ester carboxylesterase
MKHLKHDDFSCDQVTAPPRAPQRCERRGGDRSKSHRAAATRFLFALTLSLAPTVSWADEIGVVLMHGKQGHPGQPELSYLFQKIESAGALLDAPTMCWTQYRIYDRTLPDCLAEVDESIARLKKRGATAIVVGGHSLGGLGALAYASFHRSLKGVIALAPGVPPRLANNSTIQASMAEARRLIAAGQGDDFRTFEDVNRGPRGFVSINVRATPNIFMSFWDMNGLANLSEDTAKITAPIFWASGTEDPSQLPREHGFGRAAANPLSRYVQVNADHMGTPDAAADALAAWLRELAGK